MTRTIIAVITGLAAAMAMIALIQTVSVAFYPLPTDLDRSDKQALADWIAALPVSAHALVLLGYVAGSFAGGAVAAMIAKPSLQPSAVVGALLTIFGLLNLTSIPHPLWFAVVSTLAYLPMAYAGGRLMRTSAP